MKINWNLKYTTIAIYSFLVIAAGIVLYLILSRLENFSQVMNGLFNIVKPFLYGFVIAYLVNFPLHFFENWLGKSARLQRANKTFFRILNMVLAYLVSAAVVYLFVAFILPQLVVSLGGLIRNIPSYIITLESLIESLAGNQVLPADITAFLMLRIDELLEMLNSYATNLVPVAFSFLKDTIISVFNLFLGIIISMYLLAEKDRLCNVSKKINYGIFSTKIADEVLMLTRRTQHIFSRFLGGKILDSIIIGIITFIVLELVKMPFSILIAFIIGITNIIPFFGPFIGAVPSFVILLFESPRMALWFLLIIFVIQQFDGNFLGPKILGDSMGISSFWILFSILVFGNFFGFIGMIIGVPLFVLVYSIVKEIVELRLSAKGLPTGSEEYEEYNKK